MTLTAVILLLVSACTHAAWNLLGKRQNPTTASMLLANTLGATSCLGLLLFIDAPSLAEIASGIWGFLVVTGLFQALYFAMLAGAYRSGDLSIVYPLARSSPVLIVLAASLTIGRAGQISHQCLLGIGALVAGSFLLPMKRFSDLSLRNYINLGSLLALAAAVGTAGYSMVDDEALRRLRASWASASYGAFELSACYVLLEGTATSAWLALCVFSAKRGRADFRAALNNGFAQAAIMGVGVYLAYLLVLISMAYVVHVSYVVAFRQLSIILGAVLGVCFLKEPSHAPKFAGVGLMFAGLVLIGTG